MAHWSAGMMNRAMVGVEFTDAVPALHVYRLHEVSPGYASRLGTFVLEEKRTVARFRSRSSDLFGVLAAQCRASSAPLRDLLDAPTALAACCGFARVSQVYFVFVFVFSQAPKKGGRRDLLMHVHTS
jgi:hypothetical protein